MSKELRSIQLGFVVKDCEELPMKNGEQMYAGDVMDEIQEVMHFALADWYERRGHELLAYQPDW